MSKLILTGTVIAVTATAAFGAGEDPVINGTFDQGLVGWQTAGPSAGNQPVVFNAGSEIPDSPSGPPFVGKIVGFGFGTFSVGQTVDWTGPGAVDLEYFLGAKTYQPTWYVSLDVLWNGDVVAAYSQDPVDGATADSFQWQQAHIPIVGVGSNELKVQWVFRFAERSWAAVDKISVVPEPATLGLLALSGGLLFTRRRR